MNRLTGCLSPRQNSPSTIPFRGHAPDIGGMPPLLRGRSPRYHTGAQAPVSVLLAIILVTTVQYSYSTVARVHIVLSTIQLRHSPGVAKSCHYQVIMPPSPARATTTNPSRNSCSHRSSEAHSTSACRRSKEQQQQRELLAVARGVNSALVSVVTLARGVKIGSSNGSWLC